VLFLGSASAADVEIDISDAKRAEIAASLAAQSGAGGFGSGRGAIVNLGAIPEGQWVPWIGPDVEKVLVIEGDQKVERWWTSLTRDRFLAELNRQYAETQLFKRDQDGSLTFMGANASAARGQFWIVYNNFRYKSVPCSRTDPGAGEIAVGVGLRTEVDAVFKSGSFSLGFAQLALSYNNRKVQGLIRAQNIGLANSITLSTAISAVSKELSYETLIKASNLEAIAGQALESIVAPTIPAVMGYKDGPGRLPGSCLAAFQAELEP